MTVRSTLCRGGGYMRIAYIVYWDFSRENGVLKKIARQIRAWKKKGHEVTVFAFSAGHGIWPEIDDIRIEAIYARRLRNAILKSNILFKKVAFWKPDLIYCRFYTYYPGIVKLMSEFPVVLEINSNVVNEMRLSSAFYLYWYHAFLHKKALMNAAGFAFLTPETAANYSKYKKPIVVIGDSVDLNEYHQTPPPCNAVPHIVFMASGAADWHGLDKILWLSKACKHWHFDLIGVEESTVRSDAGGNVSAHGFLNRAEYENFMTKADIAIGTLALHRIGMNQTAPLKVREYLAYGLPTIVGYQDSDFPIPVDYLLELPNTETNVIDNLQSIVKFVEHWVGKRVPKEKVTHLDANVKEEKRLAFFSSLLHKNGPHS